MLARMSLHFSVSEQACLAHNCRATCLLHFALSQRWQHMSRQHQLLSIIPKKWNNDLFSSTVSLCLPRHSYLPPFSNWQDSHEKKKTPVTMFPGLPAFHFSHPHLHSRPPLAPLEALPIASSASGPPRSPWAKSSARSPGSNDGRHGGHLFGERWREGGVWLWNHPSKSVKSRTKQLKIWLFWMTSMIFLGWNWHVNHAFILYGVVVNGGDIKID